MSVEEALMERFGFRKAYEVEYRIRRSWFTDEQAQEWRRFTPFSISSDNSVLKEVADEARTLYHTSSRGRRVCLSEADAVRAAELRLELFRRNFESGHDRADGKPTALRITSHWEYFGDIEKKTAEVVKEMEVK